MKILMTGATGLIGKELGKALVERGYKLIVTSRDVEKARETLPFPCHILEADLSKGPIRNDSVLRLVDVVINLAGEPIGSGRWNESRKRRIYESRVLGTRHLIESLPVAPKIFLNASAVGYYGSQGDTDLIEDSSAGEDFLAQVCQDWEEELLTFSYGDALAVTRVVPLRTGMVLAPAGGVLEKLLPLFRRNLGSVLGDGRQWMSWIHIEDWVGLVLHTLDKVSLRGPLNLVAPQPVTNEEFTETLAQTLNVGLAPRIPSFALWAALGEMATLVLSSQKVLPQKAQQSGYKFKFPNLKEALENICVPYQDKEEYFTSEQFLPWKPEQIFPFFRRAGNVQKIVPVHIAFEVVSDPSVEVQKGSVVNYRMKVHGIPVKWRSLIKAWDPPHSFTDVQLEGPYRFWEHTHEFKSFAGGTLAIDKVRYSLPLGDIGNFIGGGLARGEIQKVFEHRRRHILKNLEQELGKVEIKNDFVLHEGP